MNTARKVVWRRIGLVGAVALVGFLGNMRAALSETAAATGAPKRIGPATAPSPVAPSMQRSDWRGLLQQVGADADGASQPGRSADDARLVPAIYAWDPDVRFVYYRHISKWM